MSLTYEITFVEDAVLEQLEERDDERISSIMFSEGRPSVSLGRAWHMIHALLTGERGEAKGPLAFIMGYGTMLGEQDANGGWVCSFDSSEVAKIKAALPPAEVLAKRYADEGLPDRIAWESKLEHADGAEYFLEPYREFLVAIEQAAAADQGMLAGLI